MPTSDVEKSENDQRHRLCGRRRAGGGYRKELSDERDLLDQYGADLVFQGHQHNYDRSKPMKDSQPAGDGKGVIYVTGSGALQPRASGPGATGGHAGINRLMGMYMATTPGMSELTLCVEQPGQAGQEVYIQHGRHSVATVPMPFRSITPMWSGFMFTSRHSHVHLFLVGILAGPFENCC